MAIKFNKIRHFGWEISKYSHSHETAEAFHSLGNYNVEMHIGHHHNRFYEFIRPITVYFESIKIHNDDI